MTPDTQSLRKPHRIDAHHHLWRYKPDEFGWINNDMSTIRRDFLPEDLKPLLDSAGISGTIAVQARQSIEETNWLLQLADNETSAGGAWIKGVVGWAPIAAADFEETLANLRQYRRLKGLRHVIQDEPDDQFILSPAFNRGVRMLHDTGLVYDILIHARHLPQTLQFVDLHPDQSIVLDHCAKPPISAGQLEPWSSRDVRMYAASSPAWLPKRRGSSGRQRYSNHIGVSSSMLSARPVCSLAPIGLLRCSQAATRDGSTSSPNGSRRSQKARGTQSGAAQRDVCIRSNKNLPELHLFG
jgi:predicted TIM-barrel fold metal-dependent hydrolase